MVLPAPLSPAGRSTLVEQRFDATGRDALMNTAELAIEVRKDGCSNDSAQARNHRSDEKGRCGSRQSREEAVPESSRNGDGGEQHGVEGDAVGDEQAEDSPAVALRQFRAPGERAEDAGVLDPGRNRKPPK